MAVCMTYRFLLLFFLLLLSGYAQAEQQSRALSPVKIQLQWKHQFQFAGIYAAKEKGFYRQAGLDVEIINGVTHPFDEVESGEVAFGLSGSGLIVEYMKGRPFIALGATFQQSPYIWLVRADSGIYSVADFKDRTVTHQSFSDDLTAIFLKQNVNLNTINFVNSTGSDLESLLSGNVDGITAYASNEPFLMQQHGVPYRIISPHDYGINFYSDVLFTSKQFLKNNPETVAAFRDATYKGWRYAINNQEELINLVLEKYNPQHKSAEHLRYEAEALFKLSLYPTVDFGHMSENRWQQIAAIYEDLGVYAGIKNLDNFIYNPNEDNTFTLRWLAISLAILTFSLIIFYIFRHRNTRYLREKIEQQTRSLQEELDKRLLLEAKATQESLRLQTLLDNTVDSVITINSQGTIENFNKGSVELFGYSAEEIIGQNIIVLMPEKYRDMHKLGMARFLSTAESRIMGQSVQLEGLHQQGHSFPIEMKISHFIWEGHHLFTSIARDISKQKAEQALLLKAKQEADLANKAKSDFLSAISHELRTPLNGILGFSQLLLADKQHPLSSEHVTPVEQIIHSGEHLLSLIDDMLELAKIDAGSISIVKKHFPIQQLIDDCMPLLQPLADEYDVNILTPDVDNTIVIADFTRLKQVFINLISTAIKYNHAGGKVNIQFSSLKSEGMLKVTIMDTGTGIATEKQADVFTSSTPLDDSYRDIQASGMGLGLSLRLIEAMGCKLDFVDTDRQGSVFWIQIPLSGHKKPDEIDSNPYLDSRLPAATELPTARKSDVSKKRVMYIEDNPANTRLIELFFSRYPNVHFSSYETAEDGLKMVEQHRPDVILMDIHLPGMSGIEAAQLIKNNPINADIAIIALTAAAMKENIDAAENIFDDYITKPVDFTLLTTSLKSYL
ncbi:hypothetical protein LCGC14_1531640 [marine sediment metagenome]|uniref:histidine kinase n=2 Tax=root TaxID=1 RepID=A0A0F9IVY5_9ZZZZ